MNEIERICVDKDILDFLKVIYFGDINDPMEAAAERAYRDLNRTIRYKDTPPDVRNCLRKKVIALFRVEIPVLAKTVILDQSDYDIWHYHICSQIRTYYRDSGVEFYYGQAQKWLNMTMKYLYICGAYTFDGIFHYLHVPIDNYIFHVVQKEFGIPCPKIRWSRWDDYAKQYMDYQLQLRSKIEGISPLRWEFRFWMQEARNLNQCPELPQEDYAAAGR